MPKENMHGTVNRLANEKSPYLLQHAHNPVDWFPWSEEAFEKAKKEDKPIFLSIGYSTCHWCHVMEQESFEDHEIAGILNKNFISIKVDREERPDIDAIYMSACQALTGRGGWPLTVFLNHDKNPFYAGTYFPKENRLGMPGLKDILEKVSSKWQNDRYELINIGNEITQAVEHHFFTHAPGNVTEESLHIAFSQLEENFDEEYGGFGSAPKFPSPHNLYFLLRYYHLTGNESALHMVKKTLTSMYRGGIYDHIGYGFCRYSTDKKWLVPHFEKMLYDNALLAIAYLEVYEITRNNFFKEIAQEIFTYVSRELTSPEGGFYSAEDADSEGEEGKFYVFTPQEVIEVLGEVRGQEFCKQYNITANGNFEHGNSIPNLIGKNPEKDEFQKDLKKLFEYREQREHPFKDDKILTSWNGLMIAALAKGSRVLNDERYLNMAQSSYRFIEKNLITNNQRLLTRYRDGEASIPGFLDDYAYLVWGLIELYNASFEPYYLEKALIFNDEMIKLFWDQDQGGLYLYGHDSETLVSRPKEIDDSALPSGNSVATRNLLELFHLTGKTSLEELAERQINSFGGSVNKSPIYYTHFLTAVYLVLTTTEEITVVSDPEPDEATSVLVEALIKGFHPNRFLLVKTEDRKGRQLEELAPIVNNRNQKDNKPTIYVCKDFTCLTPVHSLEEISQQLKIESKF
ncbi:thioredoxin domain-containing protein [Natranaerobius thermophilus]|uniref:Spermatogenesis-associated protein 20-like TRX domain-containing protein n=1 Tax=Natranaerobius thermophilus (strain ATCC BAA-1301 / DSM 18059 / JW/NM-WN-LF) TaxID=457570 RepID=B2A0I2_NATTJ|nr:thioredoxin domain-containing protein [Natranaerobius thermophilus]ACB84543.1 protein of unknown function DUF255 [Natranaerobius thermophilus JW/NM-WN-LF]